MKKSPSPLRAPALLPLVALALVACPSTVALSPPVTLSSADVVGFDRFCTTAKDCRISNVATAGPLRCCATCSPVALSKDGAAAQGESCDKDPAPVCPALDCRGIPSFLRPNALPPAQAAECVESVCTVVRREPL